MRLLWHEWKIGAGEKEHKFVGKQTSNSSPYSPHFWQGGKLTVISVHDAQS